MTLLNYYFWNLMISFFLDSQEDVRTDLLTIRTATYKGMLDYAVISMICLKL